MSQYQTTLNISKRAPILKGLHERLVGVGKSTHELLISNTG